MKYQRFSQPDTKEEATQKTLTKHLLMLISILQLKQNRDKLCLGMLDLLDMLIGIQPSILMFLILTTPWKQVLKKAISIKIISINRGSIGIANEKQKSENRCLIALLSALFFTLISALAL